jgi:hypothetical protein
MRANPQRQAVMRKIASDAVEKVFRDLAPEEEEELVTSVLRQWLTFDGHAVLLEEKARFYLILQENAESYGLTTHQVPGEPLWPFLRDWQIDLDLLPEMLHDLNVCQSVEVTNLKGAALRVSVDPKGRTIQLEDLSAPAKPERRGSPPIFCPRCTAVLSLWQPGQTEQSCPMCKAILRL